MSSLVFFKCCAYVGNVVFLSLLFPVACVFLKREFIERAAILLLFIMILNTLLKNWFQIPLPYTTSVYAFPSGHIHASAVFYGYLLYKYDKHWIKILLASLIVIHGIGLVGCHYHSLRDVVLTLPFAAFEVLLYEFLITEYGERNTLHITIASSIVLMMALQYFYTLQSHVFLAFYGMLGIYCAKYIFFQKAGEDASVMKKIIAVTVAVILMTAIAKIYSILGISSDILRETRYFFILLMPRLAQYFIYPKIR